jgi:hypothetical protein
VTVLTFNAMNTAARSMPAFKRPGFVERRAALPDMETVETPAVRAVDVMSRIAIAAVPFTALAWLFVAR